MTKPYIRKNRATYFDDAQLDLLDYILTKYGLLLSRFEQQQLTPIIKRITDEIEWRKSFE